MPTPPANAPACPLTPDRLRQLGFELGSRIQAGESQEGAWFARAPDGAPVILKWSPGEAMGRRYQSLVPALGELRSRGVPVPAYPHVLTVDGWTLTAQEQLPGASRDNPPPGLVDQVFRAVAAQEGILTDLPTPDQRPWGEAIVTTLTDGVEGWAQHLPLGTGGPRSAALLERILALGAEADPGWFPTTGLVHLDLHTDNVLIDDCGDLSGVIDWEGACHGDPRFDMVRFAFDLDGHDQPIWEQVEETGIEERVLRSYVAVHSLRCTSWQLRFHPEDVPRQLARAERVLDRYQV